MDGLLDCLFVMSFRIASIEQEDENGNSYTVNAVVSTFRIGGSSVYNPHTTSVEGGFVFRGIPLAIANKLSIGGRYKVDMLKGADNSLSYSFDPN